MNIRIATRKSALALWQANHVANALKQLPHVTNVELVPLTTRGDETLDRSLQKIGGKGLFIRIRNRDRGRRCGYCCALDERCSY